MMALVAAAIAVVVLFVLLGVRKEGEKQVWRLNPRQGLSLFGLVIALFGCFSVVSANNVGIRYSPFSGVSEDTLPEGIHLKSPFDTVYLLSTEVQTQNISEVTGQTKDAQYLTMGIDIKYRVDEHNAFEVFKQFRTLDNMNRSLIAPVVQRSIETITTQYNVIDVLGEFRNDVYTRIEEELGRRLMEKGVAFYSVTFTDTDAGSAIEQAIQAEAVAKKQVETAEQERLKTQIEAQKRVIEAKANQEKAAIDAEIKVVEAEAQAEANRMIASSVTDQLIAMKEAEARMIHGWITVNGGTPIVDARSAQNESGGYQYSGDNNNGQTQTELPNE